MGILLIRTRMLSQVVAWLGLLAVMLIGIHWLLDNALTRRRHLPKALRAMHGWLDVWAVPLDSERRAERRRQARVRRAQHQRDAIARASAPMPLDPPVAWDGNVAHARFDKKPSAHNRH